MTQVLICDDDGTTRLLLKHMLTKAIPCEIKECHNGVEALALLRQHRIDLLLLDLMMPVMGGQGALRWIRATPTLQNLQVIVLSGENDAHHVREVIKLGVVDFLLKPVADQKTKARLLAALAKIGLNPRMPEAAAAPAAASADKLVEVSDAAKPQD